MKGLPGVRAVTGLPTFSPKTLPAAVRLSGYSDPAGVLRPGGKRYSEGRIAGFLKEHETGVQLVEPASK
jgi:hypothetical protein